MTCPDCPGLAAALVVFDDEGGVLLVRHAYGAGAWHLPGGIVEQGEAPWDCARRELAEETSLDAEAGDLIAMYHVAGSERMGLRFAFAAHHVRGEARIVHPGEIAEIGWFDPDGLPANLASFARRAVQDAAEGRRGAHASYSRIDGARRGR